MHPLDSAITAGTSTFIATQTLQTPNVIPGDATGQLSKLLITAVIGIIAPIIQTAIKNLWTKLFPPKV